MADSPHVHDVPQDEQEVYTKTTRINGRFRAETPCRADCRGVRDMIARAERSEGFFHMVPREARSEVDDQDGPYGTFEITVVFTPRKWP